ncbi:MAG: GNAT family N-acetyltransferase, partial [Defluviitaleaceae bacterium]|nr:GNAT family N-acetyltransferase [Defluviitaleaceae bacterium]
KHHISTPEVAKIISYAAFDGSPSGVAKLAGRYLRSEKLHFYGWVVNERILGVCGFELHGDKVEIDLLSVAQDKQRQGVGGAMITALQRLYGLPIEAETSDGAVGFYRKRGFETTAFEHPTLGKRHTCVLGL